MASAAPSPLLKLFGADQPGPGGSLQHIRDKIYSHVWSRARRDEGKLDFVVSEHGVNRNVPERKFSSEDPFNRNRAPLRCPSPSNLHLVNKQISKDFARYIYTINDVEIDVDLKALQTDQGQAALDKIAALLNNPNFRKYTRRARVRIHFPSRYPIADLPTFNLAALKKIASAVDAFQNIDHLAIRVVTVQGAPLDYELRLALFPFYPLRLTTWSARVLNPSILPSQWDLVAGRTATLLDQAYQLYLKTGTLTDTVLLPVDKKPLRIADESVIKKTIQASTTPANKGSTQIRNHPANVKAPQTSNNMPKKEPHAGDKPSGSVTSQNSRIPTNGSLKKRQRKKKAAADAGKNAANNAVKDAAQAAEDAAQAAKDAAEVALAAVEAATNPTADDAASIAAPVEANNDKDMEFVAPTAVMVAGQAQPPQSDAITADAQPTECMNGTEEKPLDLKVPPIQISETQTAQLPPRVPPSPPRSPSEDKEMLAPVSSVLGVGTAVPSPAKSSGSKSDDIADHSAVDMVEIPDPSSPTTSSVTLGHLSEGLAIEVVEPPTEEVNKSTAGDEHNAHIPQTKKKRRNRKSKKNKAKSKATNSDETDRNDNPLDDVNAEFEVDEIITIDRESSETLVTTGSTGQVATNLLGTSMTTFATYSNAELSRGSWELIGDNHVLFTHDETRLGSLVTRDARVNRHLRANERRLAAEKQKASEPPKNKSLKKARQALLRRGNVAPDSPLSRAAKRSEGPQDNDPKRAESDSQKLSAKDRTNEALATFLLNQLNNNGQQNELRHQGQQLDNERVVEVDETSDEGRSDDGFVYDRDLEGHSFGFVESDGDSTASNSDFQHLRASSTVVTQPAEDDEGLGLDHNGSGIKENDGNSPTAKDDATCHLQEPTQSDDTSNELLTPRVPVHLRTPSNDDATQLDHTQGQLGEHSDDYSARGRPWSRRGWNRGRVQARRRGHQGGRANYSSGRGDYGSAQSNHRGNDNYRGSYSSRRGHHRGNYNSGSDNTAALDPNTQARNAWVAAAQDKDREFRVQNMERRRALEQDMEEKGTTYADYDCRVEDTFLKVDEDGNKVAEETEKIVYGPRSAPSETVGEPQEPALV